MDLTKGSCEVHAWRKEEGGGGERRAPNKAGPMRPPLLNGIKWECIETIGTYYGLDQGFMQGSCVEEEGRKEGRKEGGERRAPNKAGPMRPTLLNGIKWECIGQGLKGHYMDFIMK